MDGQEEATPVGLPNEARPMPNVLTAGQPDRAGFEAAQASGVVRVINLRPDGEAMTSEEPAWMSELGLQYTVIPVSGPDDLTEANARALDAALAGEGDSLVHCGSSNRVGALFALRAFYVSGATLSQAMDVGLAAGMTRMSDAVRAHLQTACEAEGGARC